MFIADKVQTDGSQRAPAHSCEGNLAGGKGTWASAPLQADCTPHPTIPPSLVQLNPTFAACSILSDLKAVATETEGAVSCHDAAIATPELMAG